VLIAEETQDAQTFLNALEQDPVNESSGSISIIASNDRSQRFEMLDVLVPDREARRVGRPIAEPRPEHVGINQ
jgi:hypothetical protein